MWWSTREWWEGLDVVAYKQKEEFIDVVEYR